MPKHLPNVLYEARRALHVGSQGALGVLLGSSKRSGQRWETGRAQPTGDQLVRLAQLVFPQNAEVAADIAAVLGRDLVSLGLVHPPEPPPPPSPPPMPDADVVDAVVCAAAEAMRVPPQEVRPALAAAFARAKRLGLSLDTVEKALRTPPAPSPA